MASMQLLEQEISNILTNTPVSFEHPGRSLVATGIYAQAENSKIDMVPELNCIGRTKISSNSLSFSSSSQFQVPPASIQGQMFLHAEVTYNRYVHAASTWLLDMIEQIQYQVSGNSSINNINLDGESHRDLIMASVNGEEKRLKMFPLSAVVDGNLASGKASATIPLYMPWSSPDRKGSFPIDTTTLGSNIIITIRWRPGYRVFYGESGQTPTLPTQFSNLYLKTFSTDLLNGAFSVSRAQMMNPELSYVIPTYLCQSYKTDVTVTPGTKSTVTLSSFPAGQLVALMVSATPSSWVGVAAGNVLARPESPLFNYSRLTFNGQDLLVLESEDEIKLVNALCKTGGSYDYVVRNGDAYAYNGNDEYYSSVLVMPLVYDLETALEDRHHQACKSYGGTTLQHQFDFNTSAPSGVNYTFTYTYLFNALLNVKDRVSSIVI